MFEQLARESLATDAFWRVQFVFDNEAMTADFAYTIGLADRGLPELHIMAAPRQEFTDSPWVVGSQDCARQLNEFARLLIDGRLAPGVPITCTYDGGTTTVVWTSWHRLRESELVTLLRGLAVTGRRGCSPASHLLAGSLSGVRAAFTADVNWYLSEFLCCATALLSERANFSAVDVHKFCGPLSTMLPHLEAAMNSPIAQQAA